MSDDKKRANQAIAGRLSEAVERIGGTPAAVARKVGVSQPGLNNWTSGAVRPPFEAVAKIADLAGVSLDWLATGREFAGAHDFIALPLKSVIKGDLVAVPNEDWPQVPFRRDYLEHYGADPDASFVMMVTDGDVSGIAPTNLIVVDGAARDLGSDGIYAFIRRQRLMLLNVRAKLDGGAELSRGADTEDLGPDEAAKLAVLGRVRIVCAAVT